MDRYNNSFINRFTNSAPMMLVLAAGFIIWLICFPGTMTNDSIGQYGEALRAEFNDWAPPIMSILLHLILEIGGDLWMFMLFQCLLGVFGLYFFTAALISFAENDPILRQRESWFSAIITILFLIPLTPTIFYFSAFLKDSWTAILFLWVGAFTLSLYRRAEYLSMNKFIVCAAVLIFIMGFSCLARHNTLPALLPMGIGLLLIFNKRYGKRMSYAIILIPICTGLLLVTTINHVWQVKHVQLSNLVKALDLVGLCVQDERMCKMLPYMNSHLVKERYREGYRFGNALPIYFRSPPIVDAEFSRVTENPQLDDEYLHAMTNYPIAFVKLKLEAYKRLIYPFKTDQWFYSGIVDNPFGLKPNEYFKPVRLFLVKSGTTVENSKILRWVSGVHLVWMAINILWIAFLLFQYHRTRNPMYLLFFALLLVPLTYYLSYLPFVAGLDFRYLYPSTLFVQVVTASWVFSSLCSAKRTAGFPKC